MSSIIPAKSWYCMPNVKGVSAVSRFRGTGKGWNWPPSLPLEDRPAITRYPYGPLLLLAAGWRRWLVARLSARGYTYLSIVPATSSPARARCIPSPSLLSLYLPRGPSSRNLPAISTSFSPSRDMSYVQRSKSRLSLGLTNNALSDTAARARSPAYYLRACFIYARINGKFSLRRAIVSRGALSNGPPSKRGGRRRRWKPAFIVRGSFHVTTSDSIYYTGRHAEDTRRIRREISDVKCTFVKFLAERHFSLQQKHCRI